LQRGCGDGTVHFWDATAERIVATGKEHSDYVYAVASSPDSTKLATASRDGTVKLWELSRVYGLLEQGP
jgi:WD40 repeat protein